MNPVAPRLSAVLSLDTCRSTQTIAKELARAGAPEGTLVTARRQTAGRGRHGRKWSSGPGGLWFSLVLRPKTIGELEGLSAAAGRGVLSGLQHWRAVPARLKCPNDVLLRGRKLAGLLIETSLTGRRPDWAVLGVGLNANNRLPAWLDGRAVTLKEWAGRPVEPKALLFLVLKGILESCGRLREPSALTAQADC